MINGGALTSFTLHDAYRSFAPRTVIDVKITSRIE